MQLAKRGASFWAMGQAVDHCPTHPADPFPAIMVKCNGIFPFKGKFFIHRVKAGYHGTSKETRAEWNRDERADAAITPPKRATRNNPLRRDPNTPKRWAME